MLSITTTPLPPSINTSAIVYSNGIDLFNLFDESATNGNGISVTGIVIIVLLSLICVILTAVSKIRKKIVCPRSFVTLFHPQVAIYIIRQRVSKRNNIFSLNVIHGNGVYVSTTENSCPTSHEKHPAGFKSLFFTPDIATNARILSYKSKSLTLLLQPSYEPV